MTEPMPTTAPSDPTVDELSTQTAKTMAEISRGVLTAEGVRWLKAQIASVTTDAGRRFVKIRREAGGAIDTKTYPVISMGVEPQANQWVHALDTPGGLLILGAEQPTGGLTVQSAYDYAGQAYNLAGQAYNFAASAYSRAEQAYTFAGQAYSLASSAYSLASSAYSYADTAYKTGLAAQSRADAAYGYAGSAYSLAAHGHPYSALGHGHGAHAHSYGYYYAAGLGLVWTPATTGSAAV